MDDGTANLLDREALVARVKVLEQRVAELEAVLLAHDEHVRAIGEHIIESHKPGEVDDESVAILDGYHVGARAVAGGGQGEPGETTLEAALRLLKSAKQRGAFAPPGKMYPDAKFTKVEEL